MYQRFLNTSDYLGIVTEEGLSQLIRGNELRLAQAEEAAEESIVEYLSEHYEIEETLRIGKELLDYNEQVNYPAGAHFYYQGTIYQTTRTLNGRKAPTSVVYWEELETYEPDIKFTQYTQRGSYQPGDVVFFAGRMYQCMEYNGAVYNMVQVPGVKAWEKKDAEEWIANFEYNLWDVVKFEGRFYTLVDKDDYYLTVNPHTSANWGLIGEYDPEIKNYEFSDHEYVVAKGELYYPIMNPNPDAPVDGYNVTPHDPRNSNVKKHLLRLAVYELHKLIAPHNVSSSRVADYEASIMWLRDAMKFKINPQIPRKVESAEKPVVGFATATYIRDYDPYLNPWQI